MPKVSQVNKYLKDKSTRDAMIRRNVLESSVFEGIYHVTEADLKNPRQAPDKAPRRKTG